MSAAGKKITLKMKYPMKLWPFRPATRAGQNAIAIQMTAHKIHKSNMTYPPRVRTERSYSLPNSSDGTGGYSKSKPPIHHHPAQARW